VPLYVDNHNEQHEQLLKEFVGKLNDMPCAYQDGIPAWKLVVLPLLAKSEKTPNNFWIGFSYSHSHGDGKSSLAFHHTFLQGLRMSDSAPMDTEPAEIIQTSHLPLLLPSLEEAANLSISWSFLLAPLLTVYLPTWVCSLIGLKSGMSANSHAWKAAPSTYNPEEHCTGLEILSIDRDLLDNVLEECRRKGTKLTGILHQAIAYGLSKELADHYPKPKFVATTAIDLRRVVYGDNDMINCFSGTSELLESYDYQRKDGSIPEEVWDAAKETSVRLAERAKTLADQPIGLLQYLRNFRQYMLDQLDKEREGSYELSNVGTFNPTYLGPSGEVKDWTVQRMMFSQPANAIGSAVAFNVVSTNGGDLVMTATWQRGVLGIKDEDQFIQQALGGIKDFFKAIEVSSCHHKYEQT